MTDLWRGFLPALPATPPRDLLRASLGAALGLLIGDLVLWLMHAPVPMAQALLIAPFGASAFLIFAVPNSPLAQPWSAVVGNTVSALAGLVVLQLGLPQLLAVCVAVALAIAGMALTRALHPPGGAVAIATILAAPAPLFALFPVMTGTLALVLGGMAWAQMTGRRYPFRQPAALARQGPGPLELAAAIGALRMGANIGVADLSRLIATVEALHSAHSPMTAQDVMTRDLVTLHSGDDPAHAVTLFRQTGHRHLPMLDGTRFLGLIPQTALLGPTPMTLTAEPTHTTAPDTPLADLLTHFALSRDTCLAVTDGPALRGLITRSDLLAALFNANRKD
ncbi:MAG: HPP family protein [Pseudorhodobacter sp.]|nr:HPP family protein [Pseudorhodobacter sp.]